MISMSTPDRILVIGVDAGTMDLIEGWSDEGRLPGFKRFFEEGVYGKLHSVPNMCSASAWSSMVTGVNPGKHGIYWFGEYAPNSYEYFYINASYRNADTLWDIMSASGRRVGVINVPISYPAGEVDGILIAGLDAPHADDERFTHPPGLLSELRNQLGEYIIEPGMPGYYKAGRLDEGVRKLHSTIDSRLAYASHLMKTYPWGFFMVVFTTVDSAQHFFWKYMKPQGFTLEDDELRRYQHVIRDVYVHQDEAIQQLIELAGPDTAVFVVSDHGGDLGGKGPLLPLWLEHMGMLRYGRHGRGGEPHPAMARELILRMLAGGYRYVDRYFERDLKLRLASMFPGLRRKIEAHIHFSQIDWAATKAFTDGVRPDIWINLKGRFPEGVVEPGEEYDNVCETIRAQFLAMRDARTGGRAVSAVMRKEEVYHGPYVDRAPDLAVRWKPDLPATAVALGDTRATDLERMRVKLSDSAGIGTGPRGGSGMHGPHGILFAKGPQLRSGAQIEVSEIVDIAPTLLHLAGLPVPGYMDGRVIEEIFTEEFLSENPVRTAEHALEPGDEPAPYSAQESEIIGDRLRGMGYVE
jgi:predicted AlkP superfamily phosphohydrolase/phosphomutase